MKTLTLSKNQVCIVDDADFEFLSEYSWYANWQGNKFYATTGLYDPDTQKTTQLRMHTLLMQPPAGMVVDHINGNSLDNRRENLRVCTQSENLFNMRGHGATHFKFVYADKRRPKPWAASWRDGARGKNTFLGYYYTEVEAHHAVQQFLAN